MIYYPILATGSNVHFALILQLILFVRWHVLVILAPIIIYIHMCVFFFGRGGGVGGYEMWIEMLSSSFQQKSRTFISTVKTQFHSHEIHLFVNAIISLDKITLLLHKLNPFRFIYIIIYKMEGYKLVLIFEMLSNNNHNIISYCKTSNVTNRIQ